MFFDRVIISDLYLFQHIALLTLCFKFAKYLMLMFIEKVTFGTQCLVLVIIKFTPVMLLCSISTQSFGKSRYLKKLKWHLSEIVTSMFKGGTGGCASLSVSPGLQDCDSLSGVPPNVFRFILNWFTIWRPIINKLPDVAEQLWLYSNRLYISMTLSWLYVLC